MKKLISMWMLIFSLLSCEKVVEPLPDIRIEMGPEIIELVNEYRVGKDLLPLEENSQCADVAQEHSLNMALGITDFGHDGFEERHQQLSRSLNIQRIGENVAFGQTSAAQVMDSWISSDGHRANIEGDFTHIGVGIAEDDEGRLYFTQIFIKL